MTNRSDRHSRPVPVRPHDARSSRPSYSNEPWRESSAYGRERDGYEPWENEDSSLRGDEPHGRMGYGLGPYERGHYEDRRGPSAERPGTDVVHATDDVRYRSRDIADFGAYDYEQRSRGGERPSHGTVWDHTDGRGQYRAHSAFEGDYEPVVRRDPRGDAPSSNPSRDVGLYGDDYHYGRPALGRGTSPEPRATFRPPRGYTRSDERIREDICDRIGRHAHVDPSDVEVIVSGGEVTLSGTVGGRSEKHRIEDLADGVAGVREIHNAIRVRREEPAARAANTGARTEEPRGDRPSDGRRSNGDTSTS